METGKARTCQILLLSRLCYFRVYVVVAIPADAVDGDSDMETITATSVNDMDDYGRERIDDNGRCSAHFSHIPHLFLQF